LGQPVVFFKWFTLEFGGENPMRKVPSPKFKKKTIEPLTKKDIEALLKACTNTKLANTFYRETFNIRRPTSKRDRAIILTLLDTGLRVGELCSLLVGDFEMSSGKNGS
jgi:integrase/recombinase XerC/integrase/recombinase XerD